VINSIKVSSRGQIVIPENMRKSLKINEGTKLVLIERGKKIILEKEKDFMEELNKLQQTKEKIGWLNLAERNMKKLWDNPKDEKIWGQYL
jgi:AbrB family looped-hinge helix DNA binding protein